MISKGKRVPRALFANLQNKKKTLHGKAFSLSYSLNSASSDLARFSCIVSKKVAKTAVLRNKLKRRMYANATSFEPKLVKGVVCFFYLKKEATSCTYKELGLEMEELFKAAKLLK